MPRTIFRAPFLLYLFGFALMGLSGAALAKTTWEFHKSITGAFDVRFPSEYKVKSIPLRIDEKTVLFRSEIMASVGDGPDGKSNQKVFLVKVDQSTAGALKLDEVTKLLEVDAYKYKKSAQNAGGTMLSNDLLDIDGFKGREMYITYGDGENKQAIRVKIMYTDVSRIEMVLTGPASSMYAFKSNDFFSSLKVYDGAGKIDGTPGDNWKDYESPLGLFTLRLPPENNSFVLGAPKFIHDAKKEKGRFVFVDPILGYKSFFNFYGYKLEERMDFDKVKTLLLSAHVTQYADKIRLEDLKIDTKTSEDGSYGTVTTLIRMRGLEKYPYINTILLQAIFNDHGVVVLEFLGTYAHVDMPLSKTVFSLVKFHPEKFSDERATNAGQSLHKNSLEDAGDEGGEDASDPSLHNDKGADAGDNATTLKANIKLGETEPAASSAEDGAKSATDDETPSAAPAGQKLEAEKPSAVKPVTLAPAVESKAPAPASGAAPPAPPTTPAVPPAVPAH